METLHMEVARKYGTSQELGTVPLFSSRQQGTPSPPAAWDSEVAFRAELPLASLWSSNFCSAFLFDLRTNVPWWEATDA
jgi:hypothetical protein